MVRKGWTDIWFVWHEVHSYRSATTIDRRRICSVTALSKEENKDADLIRDDVYVDFATDPIVAWDHFIASHLNLNQSQDVYLVDPRNLSDLYSAVSDHRHACEFFAGLAEHVRRLILQFLTNEPTGRQTVVKENQKHIEGWCAGGTDCNSHEDWALGYRLNFRQWHAEWC